MSLFGLSLVNSEARAMGRHRDHGRQVRYRALGCLELLPSAREHGVRFFTFVTIPDRCQERYYVVVQTESCL